MRLRILLAGALAAVALCACAGAASAAIKTPLGHAGRWFTDTEGRVTVLHGLNMVYKRPPYAPDAVGFGDDDAAFLASEGYNTVRVGLIYKAVEPTPGSYDDAYLARIQDTVDTLGRHGIVSLLDFHQDLYNERFEGEGWPDWAVQDDGLPAEPKAGFPANYLEMPALQRAFDHFWANDPGPGGVGLQDRYAAAWRHVAERFRDNPAVLGYDLVNEPWPGSTWQQCANPAGCPEFDAKLSGFYSRVRTAIRLVDSDTLVFEEPNVLFNNGADTNLTDSGDPASGFSFHDYCLTANEGGGGYGPECETSDELVHDNADKRAANARQALILTEFGATDERSALLGVLAIADRHMTSWQEWHYCGCNDPTTTGSGDKQAVVLDPAKPPVGPNLKTTTLDAVTRPFPQAVAGTPESWSFDPSTKAFSLRYTTARAGGGAAFGPSADTEVALPARQYPKGYSARVQGGQLLSAPGDPVLRARACPGVTRVGVDVTPTGQTGSTCTPPPRQLRVLVSPRRVRAGKRVTIRFRAKVGKRTVVRGALIKFAGKRVRTSRTGRAKMRIRLGRTGRRAVVASRRGYRSGRTTVRVLHRR